jgi:hypothetical protein
MALVISGLQRTQNVVSRDLGAPEFWRQTVNPKVTLSKPVTLIDDVCHEPAPTAVRSFEQPVAFFTASVGELGVTARRAGALKRRAEDTRLHGGAW